MKSIIVSGNGPNAAPGGLRFNMDSMICSWKGPITDVCLQVPLTPAMDASELLGCFEQAFFFFFSEFRKSDTVDLMT